MNMRYGSRDFYLVLATIADKVDGLVCQGYHDDAGQAFKDLKNYVTKEREACAIRVARTEAEARRRHPSQAGTASSGD